MTLRPCPTFKIIKIIKNIKIMKHEFCILTLTLSYSSGSASTSSNHAQQYNNPTPDQTQPPHTPFPPDPHNSTPNAARPDPPQRPTPAAAAPS